MTAEIIRSKPIVEKLQSRIREEVESLTSDGINPSLSVVLVGEEPGSVWYAQNKAKLGSKLGIEVEINRLSEKTTDAGVVTLIEKLNDDPGVHGILVELPLPRPLDKTRILNAISPVKDVDGVTSTNRGYVLGGQEEPALVPATPLACIELIEYSGVELRGKRVTLIGRGDTVGRPLAMLLIKRDATVTVCHTKTADLAAECRRAEILIAAAGARGLVRGEMVSPGTTVIDAGINETEDGGFTGDVAFDEVKEIAAAITPVPGGVGSLTTTMIMNNLLKAIHLQAKERR